MERGLQELHSTGQAAIALLAQQAWDIFDAIPYGECGKGSSAHVTAYLANVFSPLNLWFFFAKKPFCTLNIFGGVFSVSSFRHSLPLSSLLLVDYSYYTQEMECKMDQGQEVRRGVSTIRSCHFLLSFPEINIGREMRWCFRSTSAAALSTQR